jgi:hypothetical protein
VVVEGLGVVVGSAGAELLVGETGSSECEERRDELMEMVKRERREGRLKESRRDGTCRRPRWVGFVEVDACILIVSARDVRPARDGYAAWIVGRKSG